MSTPIPPQVLLLDFDGVLRRWPPHQDEIERRHGLAHGVIEATAFDPTLLSLVITGQIDDAMWRSQVRARLAKMVGDEVAASAVTEWAAFCGELDTDVLVVLDELKLDVVLATNATSRLPEDLQRLGLRDRFRHVVNSSEIGAAKPAVEFFRAALAVTGTSTAEVLFIDDSPNNIQAATALGIRSHLFQGVGRLRHFLTTELAQ